MHKLKKQTALESHVHEKKKKITWLIFISNIQQKSVFARTILRFDIYHKIKTMTKMSKHESNSSDGMRCRGWNVRMMAIAVKRRQ